MRKPLNYWGFRILPCWPGCAEMRRNAVSLSGFVRGKLARAKLMPPRQRPVTFRQPSIHPSAPGKPPVEPFPRDCGADDAALRKVVGSAPAVRVAGIRAAAAVKEVGVENSM